jgi:hypothetical protein
MKLKHLKALLENYPDDMEVIIGDCDWYEKEFNISKIELNHCNYTNKWSSNVDYLSQDEDTCEYKDEIDGKIVSIEIPMERKEFVILGI